MQNGVREEARYICLGMEEYGDTFLSKRLRAVSSSRVTLIQKDGTVLFDSQTSPEKLENHSNRPEFMEAEKDGKSDYTCCQKGDQDSKDDHNTCMIQDLFFHK